MQQDEALSFPISSNTAFYPELIGDVSVSRIPDNGKVSDAVPVTPKTWNVIAAMLGYERNEVLADPGIIYASGSKARAEILESAKVNKVTAATLHLKSKDGRLIDIDVRMVRHANLVIFGVVGITTKNAIAPKPAEMTC
jgi:hypothetical protein